MATARGWLRRRMRSPRRLTFTRDGKIIVVLAVGIGLAAVNTGNNLLYLLLGWSLSFIVASGILSEGSLRRLTVRRRVPGAIHAGVPFAMELSVTNDKPRRATYALELEDLVGGRPLDKRCFFLKVPPGETQHASYRHTFLRRGRYRLDGVRLATRFPFGLFRKSRDVTLPDELVVYPALVPVERPPPRAETRGDALTARRGRRGEFFGLREHRHGDDRRDVHWRSSARSGRLLVREYEDELARDVTIALDNALPQAVRDAILDERTDPSVLAQVDALERAISHAASLASSYLAAGWVVAVVARGLEVPAAGGRAHEARILRALALLGATSTDVPLPAPASTKAESVLVVAAGAAPGGAGGFGRVVEAR
ncbi:MAG: DUF58 domain-containing protein [Kofleriaceae bacterium]